MGKPFSPDRGNFAREKVKGAFLSLLKEVIMRQPWPKIPGLFWRACRVK